jgi:hypothetical protein
MPQWFDAFRKLDPARIGEISLVTNRRPDVTSRPASGRKDFLAKVATPWRERSSPNSNRADRDQFFSLLNIRHSDKGYERLNTRSTPVFRAWYGRGIANLKNGH